MFFGVKILLKLALGELMNEEMLRFSANLKSERESCRREFIFLRQKAVLCFLQRDLIKSSLGTRKIPEKERTLIWEFLNKFFRLAQ